MRAAAVLLSGLAYGLCFPPLAWRALAWVALVPALVVIRESASWRVAAAWGALLGLAGTAATVHWLPGAVVRYFGQPWAMGAALVAALGLAMVVPPVAAFAALHRALVVRPGAAAPLVGGAAFTAAELWRAHALGGNPWVLLGYSQAGAGRLAQVADLAGPYGAGFVLAAAAVALAEAWLARGGSPATRRAAARGIVTAAALLLAALVYGSWRLAAADGAPAVRVALVQADVAVASQWRPEDYGLNLDRQLALTQQALGRPVRLVVWPESAMTFFPAGEPAWRAAIARVLAPADVELLAGGPFAAGPDEGPPYRNAVFVLAPDGTVRARYDKERLLPFAERFPLGGIDLLRRDFGRVREFSPGPAAPPPLPTAVGRVGVLVCNEAFYPDLARARVLAGAQWLAVLTNDSWVGSRTFAAIAADMALVRAVEQRRWLVRASSAGPSLVVDPTGRAVAASAEGTTAVVTGEVRPRDDLTLYARLGDSVPALSLPLLALAAAARRRRTRVTVRRARLDEILALRHAELRSGLPLDAAHFEGDEEPETIHVAAVLPSGAVVGCASIVHRALDGADGWQLRGMATRGDQVRRGIGARVLAFAEQAVRREHGDGLLLWCNARVPAVPFYRAQGWRVTSPVFDVPTAGPHHRMQKRW